MVLYTVNYTLCMANKKIKMLLMLFLLLLLIHKKNVIMTVLSGRPDSHGM